MIEVNMWQDEISSIFILMIIMFNPDMEVQTSAQRDGPLDYSWLC